MPEGEVGEETAELATGEVEEVIFKVILFLGGDMKSFNRLFYLLGFAIDGFKDGIMVRRWQMGENMAMDIFDTESITF